MDAHHLMYNFPWGQNKLEEAWLELRLKGRTYWIEIPYGFTRDPAAPLARAEPDAGLPALAPAMKNVSADDRLVAWTKIVYDLDPIQNDWRLHVELANPFDARCKALLYWEGGQWDLHAPRTSAKIVEDGGGVVAASQVGARFVGSAREDAFDFCRYHGSKGRDWGTLTITVDGKSTDAVIPSSLFKCTHGEAHPSFAEYNWIISPH